MTALDAAAVGREFLTELVRIRDGWDARLTVRGNSLAWRIANRLTGHPAVTAELVAAQHHVSAWRPAAIAAGVLVKVSAGRRNQVWMAEEVTACSQRLAVPVGRRQTWGGPSLTVALPVAVSGESGP